MARWQLSHSSRGGDDGQGESLGNHQHTQMVLALVFQGEPARGEDGLQGKPGVAGERGYPLPTPGAPVRALTRRGKGQGLTSGLGSLEEGTVLPCRSPVPWDL